MSYLAEVLNTMETVEIEEFNRKCAEVASRVDKCKTRIMTFMENVYVTFSDRPTRNKELTLEVNKLEEDVNNLLNYCLEPASKQLATVQQEVQTHQEDLLKAQIAIDLVGPLYKLHVLSMEITDLNETNAYATCLDKISAAEKLIDKLDLAENLSGLEDLSSRILYETTVLLGKLRAILKQYIVCTSTNETHTLKLKRFDAEFVTALTTLCAENPSIAVLDDVTRFLWNEVFVPIVDSTTEVKVHAENTFQCLKIVVIDPDKKRPYTAVFDDLTTVLRFLQQWFSSSALDDCDVNTLSYIGSDIKDNLSELIIKHCLSDTVPVIPLTEKEREQYTVVIDATKELEDLLLTAGIFDTETTSILSYTQQIDVLNINKVCANYMDTAMVIMKKDLYNLIEVGTYTGQSLVEDSQFQQCSISKNVEDLLLLVEDILEKAMDGTEVNASKLCDTALSICDKYSVIVPQHHKKLLETIPQQVALFYNNCMYIAYNLMNWTQKYLRKRATRLECKSTQFLSSSQNLSIIAADMFKSFVERQIKQAGEIMKDAKLNQPTLEVLDPVTEKAVRQCLRQQELLKTVWQKVLPYSIYNKTLGEVLNSLCNCLIDLVTKLEDISSEAAKQLVDLLKIILTRGPKLFTDAKEVSLFVGAWHKLNELVFVLNACLVEINDRWADGKGPLALHFKSVELKQLIRALFQNTEGRGMLLSKIQGNLNK